MIVRKLGWGPRSSTWLVQASKETGGQYKALKVLTASATADSSGNKERDALLGPVKNMTYGVPELLGHFSYFVRSAGRSKFCASDMYMTGNTCLLALFKIHT